MPEIINNDDTLFGRVVTAMVTPFDEKGESIDYGSLEKLVEHLIANATETILVAGTTGESPTLTGDEKIALLKKVIEISAGRAKVIFGAGSNNTKSSVESAKAARDAGAEGLLIVAPYYNKPNQEGIFAHVKAVADTVDLPILVYNIPGRCGINIEPATMVRLARECPGVKAIKDSAGNVDQTAQLASLFSNSGSKSDSDFRIYSGDDYLTLQMLSVGACGVVSVASHLVGKQLKELIDAAMDGDLDRARGLHYRYLPLFKGLFVEPNPTCLKYILSRMGICSASLRLPLVPLSQERKKEMDSLMEASGLLSGSSI
ncbi:MAG: 4-hydroxy-tetrahydrodipicolinate synthase [Cyanobacteriota/Melainabacteria group bacterium]